MKATAASSAIARSRPARRAGSCRPLLVGLRSSRAGGLAAAACVVGTGVGVRRIRGDRRVGAGDAGRAAAPAAALAAAPAGARCAVRDVSRASAIDAAEAKRSIGSRARALRVMAATSGGIDGRDEGRIGGRSAEAGERDGGGGVAFPRPRAGEHLVQDDAEGVDVGFVGRGLAASLLRAEVVDRPERRAGQRHLRLGDGTGDPEVDDLDPAVPADQHVAGLHVAMDDAACVAAARARATAAAMRAAWDGGRAPFRRRIEARSSPSTNSMTMYGPAGSSP